MMLQDVLMFLVQQKLLDNLSNAAIAVQLLLMPPVTVASAKQSFSKMRLVKMFVHSTVLEDSCNIYSA